MPTRATLLLGAAVLLSSAVIAPRSTALAATATSPTRCTSRIEGVNSSDQLDFGSAVDSSSSFSPYSQALGFTPVHLAYDRDVSGENDGQITIDTRWANGSDGSLRFVALKSDEYDGTTTTSLTVDKIALGYRLRPRLFTFAGHEFAAVHEHQYLYRVSRSGYLYRDTYHPPTSSKPAYLDGTVRLGRGLRNARTLTAHKRITLNGKRVDVLFATTKYGRLFEITVPNAHPAQTRTIVLAKSGFARYDGLTADEHASCLTPFDHVLVGVDSTTGTGHFFALRTVHNPAPADLAAGAWMKVDAHLSAVH